MSKNAVAINEHIDQLLKELVSKRSKPVKTSKVGVVADLIIKAHKKECK